jgi:hypothetical protein
MVTQSILTHLTARTDIPLYAHTHARKWLIQTPVRCVSRALADRFTDPLGAALAMVDGRVP